MKTKIKMNPTIQIKKIYNFLLVVFVASLLYACAIPKLTKKNQNNKTPLAYKILNDTTNTKSSDTNNIAKTNWKVFFSDQNLVALIDTALQNNQELNIFLQEINNAQNEIKARKGAYLPFVNGGAMIGVDKSARYTRMGAVDEYVNIKDDKKIPVVLGNMGFGVNASWQVDIWRQLRNAKQASVNRYLASIEGRNFLVTNLVANVATAYYELMALDNQLDILDKNIIILQNALKIVNLEKTAGQVTELAVRRFQAEVSKNRSHKYYIQQQIVETENQINFLLGRFPQPIIRSSSTFNDLKLQEIFAGIPSQLLANRPDIRQAEQEIIANKLDIKVAKANFYPTFNITSSVGFEAFDPQYLITTPKSMFFNLLGGLVAPLVNRNAIKAQYYNANARQIQSVYHYERTILNGYVEVANQLAKIDNLSNSFTAKKEQVDALNRSVNIVINLFKSARADYVEILLTQRDAIESKMDLIEVKKEQLNAIVKMYQVLGGGWQ